MMNKTSVGCSCQSSSTLIFSCSGAADVGELADRVARHLAKEGFAKMYCLAGIGGSVSGIIESTRSASNIWVIDGCPLDCAKKTMLKAELTNFKHISITDFGFKKGSCELSNDSIFACAKKCKELLCP